MMKNPIYFAHISDTHILPDENSILHGGNPNLSAKRLLRKLKQLEKYISFVVHTGDIVADPCEESFRIASEIFDQINVPKYFVNGNHDSAEGLTRHLTFGQHVRLLPDKLCYSFKIGNFSALVLDGKIEGEKTAQGFIDQSQLDCLRTMLQQEQHVTIFTHYPPLPLDSECNASPVNGI